jgi:hypothetical protein
MGAVYVSDLPPGFQIDAAPSAAPPPTGLPDGFVLDAQQPQTDNRSVADKLIGAGGPRYQLWPERLVRSIAGQAEDAFTAPGRAYQGQLSPEDEIKAGVDTATLLSPANPAVTAGEKIIPGAVRAAVPVPPAGLTAAETAAGLDAPLPVGLASDNRAVQAATQAARQLPVVGQKIDTQAAKTVNAAGEGVQTLADQLAGGVTDRAATGAVLRPSLQGVIESNNAKIGEAFSNLRGMIDQSNPSGLPNTSAVLGDIVNQRIAAGQRNPLAGLEDVQNLVNSGATFDGLQRARSDIGNSLDFGQANPGFNKGDLKRIYGAMTADMGNVVRQSVKPGVDPRAAVQTLSDANAAAAPIFDANKSLQKLLNIKNDEGVSGALIRSAQDKTGNVKLLSQLRSTMPPEDFQQVSGTLLSELGQNASTGKFSLSQFATQWEKLGDRAKGVLFSQQHKQYLDNIAALGRHLKDADQYANKSGTGRAVMLGSIGSALGTAGIHALGGDVIPLLDALGAMAGGYGIATILSRPAAAASMAQWSKAVLAQSMAPNPARAAAVAMTTRNLISNVADTLNLPVSSVVRQLQGPMQSAAGQQQPNDKRLPSQ